LLLPRTSTKTGAAIGGWALAGQASAAWLGALVLLTLTLRLWGLDWQLPHVLYNDELKYVRAALSNVLGLEGRPPDYRNPSLFRHLLELGYGGLLLLGPRRPASSEAIDQDLLASALLLARLTVALLASASVPLLYLAGRVLFGQTVGLLAGLLLAVNFLHVHLSHFGLNDIPATFFLVAALVPTARLLERPTGQRFLVAGLLSGLAAATKYNFGIVLVVPAAVWLLLASRGGLSRRLLLLGPALLMLGLLAGFVMGMPEALWSFRAMHEGVLEQAGIGGRSHEGQEPDPVVLLYARTLVRAFGLPALLLAVAGLVLLLRRRTGHGLVLAALPLLYLAVMLNQELFAARFALPLVPFGCLFAAYGLHAVWSAGRGCRLGAALALIVGLAALGWPLLLSARLNLLAGQTDTRVQAKQWAALQFPPGTRLAAQTYSLPIGRTEQEFRANRDVRGFDSLTQVAVFREIACDGYQYVLTASFQQDRQQTTGRRGRPTGYEQLWKKGEPVMTFWPGPDGSSVPFHMDDVGLPFWRLEQYSRPGPTIQVYRLPAGAC
jgi:hypothetical protein